MSRRLPLPAVCLALAVVRPAEGAEGKRAVVMESDDGRVIRLLGAPLPALAEAGGSAAATGLAVVLAPGVDPAPAVAALVEAGARVVSLSLRRDGAVVYLTVPPGRAEALGEASRARPEVVASAPWRMPVPLNDDSIWACQSNDMATRATPVFDHDVTGSGEVLAVYDTGLDPDMCFFTLAAGDWAPAQTLVPPDTGVVDTAKKTWAYYVEPGASAYDPGGGHGTAVAGSVLGDDHATLSTPTDPGHDPADGMAPNARLVMLDGGDGGVLSGIVGDLTPVFLQSYRAGARIQNHSWGNPGLNLYTPTAVDLDRFTWRHEDMLFVDASGNSGRAPGDASVIDPAVAKNVLAVGASSNGSNGARDLMGFSSRGPAFDGRLRPDLVAPGSQQHTAGASGTAGDDSCGTVRYSGTSLASPTAAGLAALARQYLREGFLPSGARTAADQSRPSAALVKATMIASTVPLEGIDQLTNAPVAPPPSLDQGWGKPVLDRALYFAGDGARTTVLDLWNGRGLVQGGSGALDLKLPASAEELRAVLVWTDPPAPVGAATALVNDLDLVVTAPDSSTYLGNQWSGGQSVPGGNADRVNPVEVVRVAAPAAGDWSIRVQASRPLGLAGLDGSERQGFALVVTYAACTGAPPPVPLAPAVTDAAAGIDLAWPAVAGATGYLVYRADVAAPGPADFQLLTPAPLAGNSYRDADVQCGGAYSYALRAWDGCSLGPPSPAAALTRSLGSCRLAPLFDGLDDAVPEGSCGRMRLSWTAAASRCPCSTGVVYDVWASATAPIDPSVTPPLATCLSGTSALVDLGPGTGLTHFLVRAEDRVPGGSGPCGGVLDGNLRTVASVPVSPTRLVAHADTFEAGRADWRLVDGSGGGNAWDIVFEPLATSPRHALHADELASTSDSWAELLTPVRPTADTLVSFRHTYELEGRYDGGVVEISTDGGGRWEDAGPRIVAGRYDDWLTTGASNSIIRPAFTGGALGPMRETLLWLGDLAGQELRLRFRLLTDPSGRRQGWSIDDLQVFERDCATASALTAAFVHDAPRCLGDGVALDATSSYGGAPPYGFAWDFGDGSGPGAGATGSHLYAAPGTYVVTLTVTDSASRQDTAAMPVTVRDEQAAPALGNVLLLARTGADLRLAWQEPPGPWPGAEVMVADVRDQSDLRSLAWLPWDRPRQLTRVGGVGQGAALRSYRVRLWSTCRGTPGPS